MTEDDNNRGTTSIAGTKPTSRGTKICPLRFNGRTRRSLLLFRCASPGMYSPYLRSCLSPKSGSSLKNGNVKLLFPDQ